MFNKSMKNQYFSFIGLTIITAILLAVGTTAYSSDLSDARTLREKCETEIKLLEVSVKNFGNEAEQQEFAKGEKLLKLGNVKYIQTKYREAIETYNEYQKLQFNLYAKLAQKYVDETGKLIDSIAEDLVDFIDNKKVVEYFRLANQNLKDAKSAMSTKHYQNIIKILRTAKNYAISAYKLVGKEVPGLYKKDAADNDGKIYKK